MAQPSSSPSRSPVSPAWLSGACCRSCVALPSAARKTSHGTDGHSALERADGASDRDRGLGLEKQVVDEYVFVGAVFGLKVDHWVGVAEGDESVGDGAVGLAQDVAVAVAV